MRFWKEKNMSSVVYVSKSHIERLEGPFGSRNCLASPGR